MIKLVIKVTAFVVVALGFALLAPIGIITTLSIESVPLCFLIGCICGIVSLPLGVFAGAIVGNEKSKEQRDRTD